MSKLKVFFIGVNILVWSAVGIISYQKYSEKKEIKSSKSSYQPKMGKLQRALDINLKWVELSDNPSGVSKLSAEVVPLEPFQSDLVYQWVLPAGVSILNGSEIGSLSGSDLSNFEIEFVGLSNEEFATVVLQVSGDFNGNEIGDAGAIATREQKLQSMADTLEKLKN